MKAYAFDPVGGLPVAFGILGDSGAFKAGITCGLIFALCSLWGIDHLAPGMLREAMPQGITGFVKTLVFAFVPFVALAVSIFATRSIAGGKGNFGHDSFIAGATLLPTGLGILLASVIGMPNIEVVVVLAWFTICTTILILFSGMIGICRISTRAATIVVPSILIGSVWLSKIIFTTLWKEIG